MNKKYESFKNPLNSIELPVLKEPPKKKKLSIIKKQTRFAKTYELHFDAIDKLNALYKEINLKTIFRTSRGRILEALINEAQTDIVINSLKKEKDIDN